MLSEVCIEYCTSAFYLWEVRDLEFPRIVVFTMFWYSPNDVGVVFQL